jgi:transposase
MRRHELSDETWEVVSALIPARAGRPSTLGDRNFVNAVVWIAKTGAPWRDLPERFGNWKTIFNRFSDWTKQGLWESLFKALAFSDDEIGSLIDGSVVRAHQDSAGGSGGQKKTPSADHAAESLRKSTPSRTRKGGRSTSR